jgi:hypothetical protein
MNEPTTSLPTRVGLVPAVWRDCFSLIRSPTLEIPRERFGLAAVRSVLWLLVIMVLVDLPLVTLLSWLSERATIATPQFTEFTERGLLYTLLMGAVLAPLIEEVVFRSWLDGKRRHIVFWLVVLVTFGTVYQLTNATPPKPGLAILVAAGLLVVGAILIWRAETSVPTWFARFFPIIFYLQAVAFAASHFGNYPLDRPVLLVPFVLPQLVAGLIFGFARVRYGMWANLTLHASSNALFLTLMLSGPPPA